MAQHVRPGPQLRDASQRSAAHARMRAAQPFNGPATWNGPHAMALCKNVPALFGICYKLYGTISLVYSFTFTSSPSFFFTMVQSLSTRARTDATARALSGHASLTRTSTAYLRGRYVPRRQVEATRGDTASRGTVTNSLPDGGG